MAFVYIFKTGPSHYKIGRATDIEKRRKELSTGNPYTIELIHFIETDKASLVEKILQDRFYEYICETGDSTEHYEIQDIETLNKGFKEAKDILKQYLPLLDNSEKLAKAEVVNEIIPATEDALKIQKELRDVVGKVENLKFKKDFLECKLKSLIGCYEGIDGIATWKVVSKESFDSAQLKKKHPELYQEFKKQSESRVFKLK